MKSKKLNQTDINLIQYVMNKVDCSNFDVNYHVQKRVVDITSKDGMHSVSIGIQMSLGCDYDTRPWNKETKPWNMEERLFRRDWGVRSLGCYHITTANGQAWNDDRKLNTITQWMKDFNEN
jgi:hypothetical protein